MSIPHHHTAAEPTNATPSTAGAPIVVPSAEVRALVRFAERPTVAPDDLVAFVVCEQGEWVLTDDALAFGEPDLFERFAAWRATWEREWTLDPRSSIARLLDLGKASQVDPLSEAAALTRLITETETSDDMVIEPDLVDRCRAELGRLGDLVRARDAMGHGLVDLTPNTQRSGLARSWPSWGSPEILAALADTTIVLDPAAGLWLHLGDEPPLGPIDLTTSDAAGWTVHAGDARVRLDHVRARPLAWLVPGSMSWRHQRVPEIITWARTLSGLDDCLEFASAMGLGVRITTRRPIQQT